MRCDRKVRPMPRSPARWAARRSPWRQSSSRRGPVFRGQEEPEDRGADLGVRGMNNPCETCKGLNRCDSIIQSVCPAYRHYRWGMGDGYRNGEKTMETIICKKGRYMQPCYCNVGRNIFYCCHLAAKSKYGPDHIITRSREKKIPTKTAPQWCPLKQKQSE